jgi:hypothetical protein
MSSVAGGSVAGTEVRWGATTGPVRQAGRWALGFSAAAGVSWFVMPLLSGILENATGPLGVASDIAMAVAIALVVLAAVLNSLCLWVLKERSTLNIIAACLTIPLAIVGLVEVATIVAGVMIGR